MISKKLAVLAAGLMFGAVSAAHASDFTLKFGTASINDPQWHYMQIFETHLEDLSGGRIEVELYPQSQLGSLPRQIEGVQLGVIEAIAAPADFFVGMDPAFGVFSTPMLFRDNENAAETLFDPQLNEELRALGSEQGFVNVGWVLIGPTHYAATTPILTVEGFKGLKLRVNGTDMEREKMRRLQATGVPLPLGDVLPALQRHAIDGTQSVTSIFNAFHFNEVVDTLTVTNDTMVISPMLVSRVWFETLPEDLQGFVLEAGLKAQADTDAWQRGFLSEADAAWGKSGGKFVHFDDEQLAAFSKLLTTVGDDVTAENASANALLTRIREVAKKH